MNFPSRYCPVPMIAGAFGILMALWPEPPLHGTILTPEQMRFYQKEGELAKRSNNVNQTNDATTVAKLRSFQLDGVQWPNIDIQAALVDLEAKSREIDPTHHGIRFVLQLSANSHQADVLDRSVKRNICIVLQSTTSLFNLLMYISEQTNLAFTVTKDTVTFLQWRPDAYMWINLTL